MSELSQLCQQVFVDLVPTLFFTSLSQSVPSLTAFSASSGSTVCLGLLYDPEVIEKRLLLQREILLQKQRQDGNERNANHSVDDSASNAYEPATPMSAHLSLETKIHSLCQHAVQHILLSLQEMGVTSIILCCNEWTDRVTSPQVCLFVCLYVCLFIRYVHNCILYTIVYI